METKCYCGHTTRCDCGPEKMKQTAVEWLVLTYLKRDGLYSSDVDQAKEMEKQQITDAMDICQRTDFYVKYEDTEQYYNETYNND